MINESTLRNFNLNQNPIFIIGFPRSGTTYLQSLIATQNITTFPETHFYTRLVKHLSFKNSVLIYNEDALEKILYHINFKFNLVLEPGIIKNIDKYLKENIVTEKFLFELLLKTYFLSKNITLDEEQIWLEKTPGHAKYIEKIISIYPKASFVSIIRSPYDCIPSAAKKLASMTDNIFILSSRWGKLYRQINRATLKLNPNITCIKYEDILKERVSEMKNLFQFLELPFNENLLNNFTAKAEEVIIASESWKKNNTNRKIDKPTEKHSFIIQYPNIDLLEKYNYQIVKSSWFKNQYLSINHLLNQLFFRINRYLNRTSKSSD